MYTGSYDRILDFFQPNTSAFPYIPYNYINMNMYVMYVNHDFLSKK